MITEITQNKQIKFLMTLMVGLGGLAGILVYIDNKRHGKIKGELLDLEKKIKELEYQKLINGK